MSCLASQEGEPCRLDGNHRFHAGGYGDSFVEWENEDFLPPATKVSSHLLHRVAAILGK